MFGVFDKMFDFNGDGELDTFEKAAEFATFAHIMDSIDKENEDEYKETELQMAGIDPTELEYMNADERRTVLEDAGLDPDKYDF